MTKEKLVGDFKELAEAGDSEQAEQERHFSAIYASVQEEAAKDIALAKKQAKTQEENQKVEADIEELVQKRREQT